MTQSITYLSLALQTISLLQTQLIKHFQKSSSAPLLEFKNLFDHLLNKIKNIELQKSIQSDQISSVLIQLDSFLQKNIQMRKTSHSQRFGLRVDSRTKQSQKMQLSGRAFYQSRNRDLDEGGLSEIEEITQSYRVNQSEKPSTQMKWRLTPYEFSLQMPKQQKKIGTIGSGSLQILNQTIPEMQNRIKLLSSNRNSFQLVKEPHRTFETRSYHRRRYIPRLF